jgi:hypothetical protein
MSEDFSKKVWLVDVTMGYGHKRTAYSLRSLAFGGKIWHADDYEGQPFTDKKAWLASLRTYEFFSRFQEFPFLGKAVFSFLDKFQRIAPFYPKRNLSKPNFQLKQLVFLIKKGFGKDLIEKLKNQPLPLVTTFFTPALMAQLFHYPGEIYCVICDSDISRTWALFNPRQSRVKFFAPTLRVKERLKLYGVKEENIFLTGYPLPPENIGDEKMEILKEDFRFRLLNLDPAKIFFQKYRFFFENSLQRLPLNSNHPFTLMFAVGGAGAQKEIGVLVVQSLKKEIETNKIKIILSCGVKKEVKDYFEKAIKRMNLNNFLGKNLEILFAEKAEDYFDQFNLALRKTDVLWSKPSELSFYAGLGLPFIIAPPLGSQEEFNRDWLLKVGAAILQENPRYTNEWLFDFLKEGLLLKAAVSGFLEIEKLGFFNIKRIINQNS